MTFEPVFCSPQDCGGCSLAARSWPESTNQSSSGPAPAGGVGAEGVGVRAAAVSTTGSAAAADSAAAGIGAIIRVFFAGSSSSI